MLAPNELLINATLFETRVALLENGQVVEIYIERAKDRGIIGNIYKGKVVKVLPGMQAAFVDIGLDKAAFLYVSDVYPYLEEYKILLDSAEDEEIDFEIRELNYKSDSNTMIEDLLTEGQEILVQVSKEPIGSKGTRITSHISLPGRYLVFLPTVNHVGVSRRIEDEKERKRLKGLVEEIKPSGSGFIVRTASEGRGKEEIEADMEFLIKLWNNIQQKKEMVKAPYLIYADLNLSLRCIRDLLSSDINRIIVDSKEEYEKIKQFISEYMPNISSEVVYYQNSEPIFDNYGLEAEINKALGKKVWLKSGGYIIIEPTEALVAIDVNTGRYVGKRNLEDTILQTNLEAAKEIAYQLRLRNIGGIIIIDFIDMQKETNREKVFRALEEALKNDKAKCNILKISELGLIEMTRKRNRESLGRSLSEPCPYCDGSGFLKSKWTICYDLFRELERNSYAIHGNSILIEVNPDVASLLYDEERTTIEYLEKKLKKRIIIKAIPSFHQEEFDITTI
ncbi:MAG: Rne/Rng family ribonuclease [Deltaproteobacteria bacterium]|nr:Rne/Rng family ribonuclease [Deltaproteobacteria bacterium]